MAHQLSPAAQRSAVPCCAVQCCGVACCAVLRAVPCCVLCCRYYFVYARYHSKYHTRYGTPRLYVLHCFRIPKHALQAQLSYCSAMQRRAAPSGALPAVRCFAVPCCSAQRCAFFGTYSTRYNAKYQSHVFFVNYPRSANQNVTSPASTQQSTGQHALHM